MKKQENGVLECMCAAVFTVVVFGLFVLAIWFAEFSETQTTITNTQIYELCSSNVSTGSVTEGSISGGAILGTGFISGNTSTEFVNVYRLTYIDESNIVKIINLRDDVKGTTIIIVASTEGDSTNFKPTIEIHSSYILTTGNFGYSRKSEDKIIYTITVHKDTIYNI